MASRNGGRPYTLVYLQPAKDAASRCLTLALRRRVARALSSDIQLVEAQLSTRPIRWGDPLNNLRGMEMVRCRGHSTFFYVYYGVHRKSRTVYVRDLQVDPYGPLG